MGRLRHGLHAGDLQPAGDGRALDQGHDREARRRAATRSSSGRSRTRRTFPVRGPAHRQAVRPRPQDEPLQVRDEGLPRLPRARERRAPRSSTTRRRSARRRRATTGSTRSTRSARRRSTRRSSRRSRSAGSPSTTRKTFTDIRESIDEAHRDGTILETVAADFPRFVNTDPRPRADAPQAAERGQEALSPHELALVLHRQDDDVPARRRDEPSTRTGATTSTSSSSPRRSPPSSRSGGRSWSATARSSRPPRFPLERGKIYEGGNLHDLERAPRRRRATRSSTSATTSTATSCAARRRAPGARR